MDNSEKLRQLIARFKKAQEYEKSKFKTDTPENQELAIETLASLLKQICDIWDKMPEAERMAIWNG